MMEIVMSMVVGMTRNMMRMFLNCASRMNMVDMRCDIEDIVFDARLISQSHEAGTRVWTLGRLGNNTFLFYEIPQQSLSRTRQLQI